MAIDSSQSRWIKCVASNGNIRAVAIQGTALAQAMAAKHRVSGAQAKGLAEAVLGGLLIASYCKSGERINLNVRGSGIYSQALIDAYPEGHVRGFVSVRSPEETLQSLRQNTGPWGEGLLSVLRTKREEAQPYIGTVPLATGHLAKDLTYYWHQSEQIPSAVGLAVRMKGDEIESAGAFLVQIMPGASTEEVRLVDANVHLLSSFAEQFLDNESPIQILSHLFQDSVFVVLEEKNVRFQCNCSIERVERSVLLLGLDEVNDIKKQQKGVEISCDFCSTTYRISDERIAEMLSSLTGLATKSKKS